MEEDEVRASVHIDWYIPEHITPDGVTVDAKEIEFDVPFSFREEVYYAYKRFKKWVLVKTRISMIGITNIPNIKLENGMCICDDQFDRLFRKDELEKAQDYCIQRNKRDTVKICS